MRTILGLIGILALAIVASNGNITESTTELHLDDMDNFSLMRFFNRLQFDELLNLAEINSRFHHLIGHYMLAKHNIHKKVIRLRNVDNFTITEQAINIGDTAIALRFLRHFGHLITKLEYTNKHHNFVEHLEISHSIQRYCARTLLEIKLASVRCYLIGDVNNTFNKVASVDFGSEHFPRDNLRLHRIYPRMERLNFSIPYAVTLRSLGQTYAHLKQLEFNEYDGDTNLRLVLRANRQLRSLRLNMCPTADLLRFVDANVPALDALHMPCDASDWSTSVFMKNVRNFSVSIGDASKTLTQFPITFDCLETLQIRTNDIVNIPNVLIEQNSHIKVLSIQINDAIGSYSRVLDFINQLPELTELHVSWTCAVSVSETLQLMDRSVKQLEKISFIVTQRTFCDDLLALPVNQWQYLGEQNSSSSSVKYVTFVRQW